MSFLSRILRRRDLAPIALPSCVACRFHKRVAVGIEVCERGPRNEFCDIFRKRPPAFGGCGVRGRYFEKPAARHGQREGGNG